MVAYTLAKHARNLINDVFLIEDTPLPAEDALYYDSLHINEWSIDPLSKKKKYLKKKMPHLNSLSNLWVYDYVE